jgi:hypothetical protein
MASRILTSTAAATLTNNGAVAFVDLPVIAYSALLRDDPKENAKLLHAASVDGFFQLDLANSPEHSTVLRNLSAVYSVGQAYFAQPSSFKQNDQRIQDPSIDRGYAVITTNLRYCRADLATDSKPVYVMKRSR